MTAKQIEHHKLVSKPFAMELEDVANELGFTDSDVRILVASKVLPVLGSAKGNERKYVSTTELRQLASDAKWLSHARLTIIKFWSKRNSSRQPSNQSKIRPEKRIARTSAGQSRNSLNRSGDDINKLN